MRAVKSRNTKPELIVRHLLYSMGYRYRLHQPGLPGVPDIVFLGRRKVIFVHGCFWHGHVCSRGARVPASNTEYWTAKIGRNVARDRDTLAQLADSGWAALVLWECELGDGLAGRLKTFLD